jgi:ATP-dependent protease ClpP protease subunit
MNKLKFTNISDSKAVINLYGSIGGRVDGNAIADDIRWINEDSQMTGITEIEIKINSMGGNVLDGYSICTEILDSKIPVTTVITGMAYSIAGVIAMCGHTRKMTDYGSFMMHDVSGGGGNKAVLDLLSNSLARIFKGTTSLTIESARELMKVETWMSPEKCIDMGLIDEILPTEIERPALENVELYEFYNTLLIKKDEMLKIKNELSLEDNASEEKAVEKIIELKNEADIAVAEKDAIEVELKNEKQVSHDLAEEVKGFKDAAIEVAKAAKEEVINNAFEAKKIDEKGKESFLNSDMDAAALEVVFNGIKTLPEFKAVIEGKEAQNDERSSWDYSKWEKEDEAGLFDLQNNHPAEFERLVGTIKTGL